LKVAVTGGAGYIGSLLVKRLIDKGFDVVSVDNLLSGDYNSLFRVGANKKAQLYQGDIRDLKLLLEKLEGADVVAHLAAVPGLVLCDERPNEAVSINVYGTHQVLEAARRLDIGRVVFCSSAAVYGRPERLPVRETDPLRPLNLYGVTKLSGEKLMEAYWNSYGVETVSLRFGNVYGVGLFTNYDTVIPKFVRQGLGGESLTVFGDGSSSRDFVHVDDVVQALLLSIEASGFGGEAFNIGSETVHIGDLAVMVSELIEEETGRGVSVVNLPARVGETKNFSYDVDKIVRDLGYRPVWDVRQGVEQVIRFCLEELG
jgi:UDP-glucose 4-epimerase